MPDEPSRSHGPGEERAPSHGDGPHPGRSGRAPDGSRTSGGTASPAARPPTADSREYVRSPGDLDRDEWDQEAALAAFMADVESGLDLFTSGIGLEPDEADELPPPGEPAAAVRECLDAGFLPRGVPGPGQGGGSGFASGDVPDMALPDAGLAGLVDAAAGQARDFAGLDDDELIGVLVAWRKTEAWAAAGRLSAVAELIRRRPVERSGGPGTADGPAVGPSVIPGDAPGGGSAPGDSSDSGGSDSGGSDSGGGGAAGGGSG